MHCMRPALLLSMARHLPVAELAKFYENLTLACVEYAEDQ